MLADTYHAVIMVTMHIGSWYRAPTGGRRRNSTKTSSVHGAAPEMMTYEAATVIHILREAVYHSISQCFTPVSPETFYSSLQSSPRNIVCIGTMNVFFKVHVCGFSSRLLCSTLHLGLAPGVERKN